MVKEQSLTQPNKGIIKPYKLPKLYSANNSLVDVMGKPAKWYVYYYFKDPQTGIFKRFKDYGKLNLLTTIEERNQYAESLIKHRTELLKKGYNPFLPSQEPLQEEVFGEVLTLAQAIEAYINFKQHGLRVKTMKGYRSGLNTLLQWVESQGLAQVPLADFKVSDLEPYFIYGLAERKWATTTHNSELTTIRAFFSHWHDREMIRRNPAKRIKRLREEVGLNMAYSDEQIDMITSHIQKLNSPRSQQLYQFIRWLYYTCIRPKELLALKVGDIRWSTNTILVPAHVSKNGRTEPVDISPGLMKVLREMNLMQARADWYIFGNQARGVTGDYNDPRPGLKPIGVNYFSQYYREVLDELKLGKEYTLYAWKHTRNIHLYVQDKDLLRLMRHNRHSDPKVTMRYLRSLGVLLDSRIENERMI